ncbi:PucR family transcriptional regulator [Actinomadura macrotermitis]|uniref:PucR family transcriptional regulator n=1 Tax=Actinomadura macrotermitis TaxID=2585200 RepID=A0A7K0C2P9_9ACTN|nr:helix-turn-helix domain-containing protein [Actinomadura macrotermitis]MQY07719.1 hypothetical protein [Actinomadura macrotermitis]
MAKPVTSPLLTRCAPALLARMDRLGDTIYRAIITEVEFYAGMDAELLADMRAVNERTVTEMLTRTAAGRPATNAPARRNARRRALQGVPVDALLQAYRIGIRVLWEEFTVEAEKLPDITLEEMAQASTAMWTMADTTSQAVNEVYRDTMVGLARDDERQRLVLLSALFEGRVADWVMLGGTGRALGLPERGPYLGVAASHHDDVAALERGLLRQGLRSAWQPRADELAGIVAVPQPADAALALTTLDGLVSGRAGVSPPYSGLRDTADGLRLALLARAALPAGSRGAATLDERPVAALVAASPDLAGRLITAVLRPVLDHPDHEALLEALEVWLETGGSTAEVAARLFCHRNTVRNRLDRVERLTGRSLSRPADIATLYAALWAHRLKRD